MAKTANQKIEIKEPCKLTSIPVASGETIYQGTLVAVGNDGYLYNLDSAVIPGARGVGFVADDSDNATGPAATTTNGSISGTLEEKSIAAGDKTVRNVYLGGQVKLTFTSIAQSDLFKIVYASDNYTVDEVQAAGVNIGTLVTYLSATSGYVDLNQYYRTGPDGVYTYKGALTAVTGTAGGGLLSWANPTGETILVEDLVIDVTTEATGAATADIGVAADGTTSSDTIYDGLDVGAAAILANATSGDGGTNGQLARKMTSSQYITGTASATLAGLVGTYTVKFRLYE